MEKLYSSIRAIIRFLYFQFFIFGYLTFGLWIHFSEKNVLKRRRRASENVHRFCKLIIKAFDIEVVVKNKPSDDKNFLYVGNHLGFIDILVLASIQPYVFVTSIEMKDTPLLGILTDMGGCIYVERRSRTNILNEQKNISQALLEGFRVVLYPEAMATNGEKVIPFKRTLLMAASQVNLPVQPAVFNVREINGEKFVLKWRDHICWYGDMSFVTALWNALNIKSLTVELEYLPQVLVESNEDRADVADRLHQMVADKYSPVILEQQMTAELLEV